MSTFFASTILVFSVLVSPVVLRWVNEYDKDLKFECPRGEHLSRLESQHSNKREDRVWNFECRNGFVTANCIWTGNQNSFDRALNFKCKDNGLIVGLSSWHHNAREDRVWQFKCCKLNTKPGSKCTTSDYINDWDDYMNYYVERGSAIIGLESYHSNSKEDRRWKVHHCEFTECKAAHVRFLDELKAEESGTKVIGVVTSQGCYPGASYTTTLDQQGGTEETYSVEDTKEHSFSITTSIGVSLSAGAEIRPFSASTSFHITQSFSYSFSFSKTVTNGRSNSFNSGTSQQLKYTGPAAALIVADVKEYKIEKDNFNVEYIITCDDGDTYKELSTVSVRGHTYGQAHYTQRYATLGKEDCTLETEMCIDNIRGEEASDPLEVILDFEKCLSENVTVF